jgi:hypothetical protein
MPVLLASEVMDLAAAALNDANRTTYDYDTQIPYLKLASQELQEIFELNSLPVTERTSAAIPINAGVTKLIFDAPSQPRLPDNLIEPQELWERDRDSNPWIPMDRKDYLPHGLEGINTNMLMYWTWQNNEIKFLSSNQNNDVKIDYVGSLFPKYIREDTIIPVINGQNFLAFRTAGLIADLIENNAQRSEVNNTNATLSLDRIAGISIKGKQVIMTRRRPFRSAYKRVYNY